MCVDLNPLIAKLKQLIRRKFKNNFDFQGIDNFIEGLSQKQLNEFIKQLDVDPNSVQSVNSTEIDNFLQWCLYMKTPIVDAVCVGPDKLMID